MQSMESIKSINIYSGSKDELGRLLSNFALTPFIDQDGKEYKSVEGWWYYYVTGMKYDYLRFLYGLKAKKEGKKYERINEVSKDILKQIYLLKLEYNPNIKNMLLDYNGEFDHYYVFVDRNGNSKNVPATRWLWTAKLYEEIRYELKNKEDAIKIIKKWYFK
jgi:hypothetical protein